MRVVAHELDVCGSRPVDWRGVVAKVGLVGCVSGRAGRVAEGSGVGGCGLVGGWGRGGVEGGLEASDRLLLEDVTGEE